MKIWVWRASCNCGYKSNKSKSEWLATIQSWWHRFLTGHSTKNTYVAVVGDYDTN
jgi:hypothetical protein